MTANLYHCDCNAINTELVEEIASSMPEQSIFASVADFFKIMGNDTRCKILYSLSVREMCVCDLANILSMTKSSVSHQLSKMREAGVVKCRRDGKEVYYSLDDEHISSVFAISLAHINHKHTGGIL
ncbi:MAG: winged helix-turn-helix transcriptional regulator [Ruminococcus sp.]|nr:winged helix-turn-helix transcriptional regulator [Ruminococcus sp.]